MVEFRVRTVFVLFIPFFPIIPIILIWKNENPVKLMIYVLHLSQNEDLKLPFRSKRGSKGFQRLLDLIGAQELAIYKATNKSATSTSHSHTTCPALLLHRLAVSFSYTTSYIWLSRLHERKWGGQRTPTKSMTSLFHSSIAKNIRNKP